MSAELAAFERFCHALVLEDGGPMSLEPFQREMLAEHFDGAAEVLILVPKKNGKSTLLAALALFHLCTTPDAECVVGAASRDQATILYDQAAGFVRRSPGLEERVNVKRGYREVRSRRDAGRMRVLAADVDTADGVIPTLALVDELHRHKSAGLYGIFRDGLGPREGRMITISTAGDSESSPLGLMRQQAQQLPDVQYGGRHTLARTDDGMYVMHEWALGPDDDVDDLRTVKLANPASWQTVARLKRRRDSPSMLPAQWARFACGLWMAADSWWITGEQWRNARSDTPELAHGDRITIGFDGSRSRDATALVACRLHDGMLTPLDVWEAPADQPAWRVHSSVVDAAVARTFERYDVVRGYFDPPLWQSEIDRWGMEYGDRVKGWATNTSRMVHASERFRSDLIDGKLSHSGDSTLSSHVMNARIREVRGGYWLTKDRDAAKIDAAVAAVLAYEARCDAIVAGELEPKRRGVAFL